MAANANEQQPELELLEFLADWQTDEGVLIYPEQLQQMPEFNNVGKEVKDTDEND